MSKLEIVFQTVYSAHVPHEGKGEAALRESDHGSGAAKWLYIWLAGSSWRAGGRGARTGSRSPAEKHDSHTVCQRPFISRPAASAGLLCPGLRAEM